MSNMMSYFNAYNDLILEQEDSIDKNLTIKFTNNIASEFTQTMNEFTSVCAKMIEERNVDKELYEKFKNLHEKIKKLVDAAKI